MKIELGEDYINIWPFESQDSVGPIGDSVQRTSYGDIMLTVETDDFTVRKHYSYEELKVLVNALVMVLPKDKREFLIRVSPPADAPGGDSSKERTCSGNSKN